MPGLALSAIAELLDILPDAVLMVDAGGLIVYANPSVRSLLGWSPAELHLQPLSVLVPRPLRQRHEELVREFREKGPPTMMGSRPVLSAVHRSGRAVPVSISICNLALEGQERVSVAVVHDITALNTHLDRATALAETDALTGLGNRLRLSRRMQGMLTAERPFAVLLMDLRHFEPFNEHFGHEAGDQTLRVVGRRLLSHVRDKDIVARLGSDEFAVLLEGLDDPHHLYERAMAIQASIERPLRVDAGRPMLGVNIGGAIRPRHGNTERELLAAADEAMVLARRVGDGYRLAPG